MTRDRTQTPNANGRGNGFLEDGYQRVLHGIDTEVRKEVERKYADALQAARPIECLLLLEKIENEVAELVAERSQHVSPDALF